jgi:PTH1 family peptidyl-tRNA hydrolase
VNLIVGLGNPGDRYAETRHNAGFWFLDALLREARLSLRGQSRQHAEVARGSLFGHEVILARPTTFMNHSGQAVRALCDYFRVPVSGLLIAYDDLDLPPGTVRLKQGGGHGGHNGLRDLCRHLPDADFLRLRIGIGHPGHRDAVTRYVLGRAPAQVRATVDEALERAVEVMPLVLEGRLQEAMTRLHSAPATAQSRSGGA